MPVKTVDIDQEYAKNKDLQKADIESLKQWIEKQPHLPKLTEFQLILFFQSCYCKIELAKRTIDTFFTLKTEWTEVFENRDPNIQRTKEAMDCCLYAQLPQHTPEGYRLLYFTFIDGDASKFVLTDVIKVFDMNIRLWLQEDGTAQGLIMLIDMKKLTLGHIAKIGIFTLRNLFIYLQEAMPVRLKGLHFFNAGVAAEKLIALSKPFMKTELAEMLILYADVPERLFNVVPKECFPKDLGGNADSVSDLHDSMKKKLLYAGDYFLEDEKLKVDESKRLEKRSNFITDQYGMDGSFKKLEID